MNVVAAPPLTATDTTSPGELQAHMLWTYFSLRMGVVFISVLLPVVVGVVQVFVYGKDPLPSISDSYFAGEFTRNWFVGSLCAGGALLYLYKGFSNRENYALNLAGLFAALTAMLPCACLEPATTFSLHAVFAVSFFLAMAFVCLFCGPETLELSHDETFKAKYRRLYRIIGGLLVASPAAAFVLTSMPDWRGTRTFFVEAFAVWVFAAYWGVKSIELSTTQAEEVTLAKGAMRVAGTGVVRAR